MLVFQALVKYSLNGTLEICSKPSGDKSHLETFKYAKCVSANEKEFSECRDKTKDLAFFALDNAFDTRFAAICCNLRKNIECGQSKARQLCGEETVKFANSFMQGVQLVQLFCARKLDTFD